MKPNVETSMRTLIVAACVFLAGALVCAPSASLQQGGTFTLSPTVVPGGSGASSSCSKRVEGSIGQAIVSRSSSAEFEVESGFWPNSVTCPLALSPITQFYTMAGGPGSINIIATGTCGWTASVTADWIVLTSADSGIGKEVVTFEVRENFTGNPRQASININGFAQSIVQDAGLGAQCNSSFNPRLESFAAIGGSGTINVTADGQCAWQAFSSVGWITITSASVGIGNGTLAYCVEANPGPSGRAGSVIISGKKFSVKQKGN